MDHQVTNGLVGGLPPNKTHATITIIDSDIILKQAPSEKGTAKNTERNEPICGEAERTLILPLTAPAAFGN